MMIIITGASSGIGEALAYSLAAKKMPLTLLARRDEKLNLVAKKCREFGAEVHSFSCDVSNSDQLINWSKSNQ